MKFELDRRFKKRLQGKFDRFNFEVGILDDKPHRKALGDLEISGGKVQYQTRKYKGENVFNEKSIGTYAGGRVRKASRQSSGLTIAQVSAENSKRLGFNYLQRPFTKKGDQDILRFADEFVKMALGRANQKRVVNLLQAIVRNPILRGEYGAPNSKLTQVIKGFDRPMIDTGQLFKAIRARLIPGKGRSRG